MFATLKSYKLTSQTWSPENEKTDLPPEMQEELLQLHKEETEERENNETVTDKAVLTLYPLPRIHRAVFPVAGGTNNRLW